MKTKVDKALHIKCVIFDVDGVLTDGQLIYSGAQEEMKSFHVRDGLGVNLAKRAGLITGIITARDSKAVETRAIELKVDEVFLGKQKKIEVYHEIKNKYGLEDYQIAYMGDDLIDFKVLKTCGLPACPADAVAEVKNISEFVSSFPGGCGAARDLIDFILKSQNKYTEIVEELIS